MAIALVNSVTVLLWYKEIFDVTKHYATGGCSTIPKFMALKENFMKTFMLSVTIVSFLSFAVAMNAQSTPEPSPPTPVASTQTLPNLEWPGRIYVLQSLVPLEHQTPHAIGRTKGFTGAETVITFEGASSPTRTSSSGSFVVKLEQIGDPPVYAYKLTRKGNKREMVYSKTTSKSPNTKDTKLVYGNEVELSFTGKQGNTIVFSPASPLAPGEYWLGTNDGKVAYLFGVD